MIDDRSGVGQGIAAALQRASELERSAQRKLRIRLTPVGGKNGGLRISARIAARSNEELAVQESRGVKLIQWHDLDTRAAELPGLVEEVARDVLSVVARIPKATLRQRQSDDDGADFANLVERYAEAVAGTASTVMQEPASHDHRVKVEAVMLAGLRLAAMSAFSLGVDRDELADALANELTRVRVGADDVGLMQGRPRSNLDS